MELNLQQRKLFLNENYDFGLAENRNNEEKFFNVLSNKLLQQCGLPSLKQNVKIDIQRTNFNGKYDFKSRKIYLFPYSIGKNKFQYFHTLIHETTHLIQDFIIKNNISRENINNMPFDEYKNKCYEFFKNNNLKITEEMFEKFKYFINNNKYFKNEILNIMYKDLLTYSNISFAYDNNVCEIMANEFAISELDKVFFKNKFELEQHHIDKIKQCIDKDFKKFEKIHPERKTPALITQKIIHFMKNIKLNYSLRKSNLYDVKTNNINNMKNVQDFLDFAITEIKSKLYYSKDENELEQQMAELFNSIDTVIPNFETKSIDENDDHDEP